MKKLIYTLTVLAAALAPVSCSTDKGGDGQGAGETLQSSVNASESNVWQYFSFDGNRIVGTGNEDEPDNAAWGARTDWDIAFNKYTIRTNSGEATKAGASGGVHIFESPVTFASVVSVPSGTEFKTDKAVTETGMVGTTTTVKSEATVILFQLDAEGNKVMPPVYLQAPVYLFRSAVGNQIYKVLFTQYQNEEKESGHIVFSFAAVK